MANEIGTAFVGVQLDAAGMQQQLGGLGPKLQGGLSGIATGIAAALGPAGMIGVAVAGTAVVVGKALYGIGASSTICRIRSPSRAARRATSSRG